MKRLQQWSLGIALILGLGAFTMVAPPVSAANVIVHIDAGAPPNTVYHYTYYPDEEVYFDPAANVYWWSVDGEWRSGPRVPEGIVLGASVNLDVDGREPWRHHAVIIEKYPRHHHEDRDRDRDHDRDRDRH